MNGVGSKRQGARGRGLRLVQRMVGGPAPNRRLPSTQVKRETARVRCTSSLRSFTSNCASLRDSNGKRPAHVAPSKAKPAHKAASAKKATPARHGTKTAKILDLLERPDGVTLKELIKGTGWQAHSVRGFLSGAISKKMGIRVESSKRPDGDRSYRISSK